ncbi:MAG: thioredoxin-like domain-containing protein, partial [Planctomycetaceae bacterium]
QGEAGAPATPAASTDPENPFPKAVKVPPGILDGGVEWFNTSQPLDLSELRGKVVLLDFWTYCCINCMHILPELKKLEQAYPNELVVIGVHSAKFEGEKETKNIEDAILRYEIEHPVINDADHGVWNAFGVNSWPTIVLLDPEGLELGRHSGEFKFESMDAVIKELVPIYREEKLLDETPIRFELLAERQAKSALRYPGKILTDDAGKRVFIADSNHNRIV